MRSMTHSLQNFAVWLRVSLTLSGSRAIIHLLSTIRIRQNKMHGMLVIDSDDFHAAFILYHPQIT